MRFDWRAALGGIVAGSDPDFVDKARRKIHARVAQTKLKHYRRRQAEKRIEIAACEAIVEAFAEAYPDRRWAVSKSWPRAFVMIADGEAIVEPWLGPELDDADGIEPVKVPVQLAQPTPHLVDRFRSAIPWGLKESAPLDLTHTLPAAAPPKAGKSSALDMLARKGTRK